MFGEDVWIDDQSSFFPTINQTKSKHPHTQMLAYAGTMYLVKL